MKSAALDPASGMMVDAPAGAEAFATTHEEHGGHHGFVGIEKESVNTRLIGGIVAGTITIILGLILLGFAITEVKTREIRARRVAETSYPEIRALRAEAVARLSQYGVADPAGETYRIPIDRAIELMANEQFQQEQTGSYSAEVQLIPAR